MTEHERKSALWATLRHYVHIAHHGLGGEADFSGPNAQWILRMTVNRRSPLRDSIPSPRALAQD